MHRFFIVNLTTSDNQIVLNDKKEIHHLKNVLRCKSGDPIIVFNGQGVEATGIIQSIKEQGVTVQIEKFLPSTSKKILLSLACAIPKKTKFELIIEKCTELGVDEIIPLKTERTEFKYFPERLRSKLARFQTVALNAAKQSKQSNTPTIYSIAKFENALKAHITAQTLPLIPCLTGTRENLLSIFQHFPQNKNKILFFIGPEGDFTNHEIDLAINSGCRPISLGPTTLKVETAAITVIATSTLFLSHEK